MISIFKQTTQCTLATKQAKSISFGPVPFHSLAMQVAELHAAALAQDAAVFDYDSHYDAIQETRARPKHEEKMQRKSRYVEALLGASMHARFTHQ